MPNYKESQITGTTWQRCNGVHISNPYGAAPSVQFSEEIITVLNGNPVTLATSALTSGFDTNAMIELLDPETMQPTGQTMSEGAVYLALFSKYMAEAKKRDDVLAATNTTAPAP